MAEQTLNTKHWTDDELLNRLYGLDPAAGSDPAHLDRCKDCGARWSALLAKRESIRAGSVPLVEARLREQRELVWKRIEQTRRPFAWRMIPVAATALVVTLGISLHRGPAPVPDPRETAQTVKAEPQISDAELFTEIASAANTYVPRGADPLRNLFDAEGQATE